MTLKQKLFFSFAIIFGMIAALLAATYLGEKKKQYLFNRLRWSEKQVNVLNEIRHSTTKSLKEISDFLDTGDVENRNKWARASNTAAILLDSLNAIRKREFTFTREEEEEEVEQDYFVDLNGLFQWQREQTQALIEAGDITRLDLVEKQFSNRFTSLINHWIDDEKGEVADALAQYQTAGRQIQLTYFVIGLFNLLLVLFIYFRIILSMGRSVGHIKTGIHRYMTGDLGHRITVKSQDEISDIGVAFNKMAGHLNHTTVTKTYLDQIFRTILGSLIIFDARGHVADVNPACCQLLGYQPEQMKNRPVTDIIHTADGQPVNPRALLKDGPRHEVEHRLMTRQGQAVPVLLSSTPLPSGGAVIVAMDITDRLNSEATIKASLKEKEVLLKEIHHRVKNNMSVVSSLLSLQAKSLTHPADQELFRESQNRVRLMGLIHEKLYKSDNLARVDFNDFIQELADIIFKSYHIGARKIALEVNARDIQLEPRQAIPCGLIITELLSNALKYAFPDDWSGEPKISISIEMKKEDEYRLIVADNGVGINLKTESAPVSRLGLRLVHIITEDQLKGTLSVENREGTKYTILF